MRIDNKESRRLSLERMVILKYKDLGCGDKVSRCEGCGKKFCKKDNVRVNREFNIVTHLSCEEKAIKRIIANENIFSK